MENYEQKYKEALGRANAKIETYNHLGNASAVKSICEIFPELKESEDDVMRKMAIKAVNSPEAQSCIKSWGVEPDDVIAWLEKQGEKMSWSEKDERIKTNIIKLLRFVRDTYHQYSDECNESIDWLKKQSNKDTIEHILPELKESEDEEIRKEIISYLRGCYGAGTEEYLISKRKQWIAWLEKQGEQKPTWSEEDETTRNNIRHIIRQYDKISKRNNQPCWYIGDCLLWMQNIKDRVQPKQEWSEEDKKLIDDTCYLINKLASGYGENVTEPITLSGTQMIASIKDRLRALVDNRPQSTWKPSDEQIEYLAAAVEESNENQVLESLYNDLKKLKEE